MKPTKVGKSAVLADFSESTAEKSESTADFSASEETNFHTKHSKKAANRSPQPLLIYARFQEF